MFRILDSRMTNGELDVYNWMRFYCIYSEKTENTLKLGVIRLYSEKAENTQSPTEGLNYYVIRDMQNMEWERL